EVAMLAELLAQRRPPWTVVFTSHPGLMLLPRSGAFDPQAWARQPAPLPGLAHRFPAAGAPAPPSPAGLLAALPRLVSRFGPDVLGEAWAYGQAGAYWLNAAPENWRRLLLHLANHHPAYAGRFQPEPPVIFPEVALWH